METFLEEAATHLSTLREAAQREDAQGVKRTAHALSGICLSVGASRLSAICSEIEMMGGSVNVTQERDVLVRLEEEFGHVMKLLETELSQD